MREIAKERRIAIVGSGRIGASLALDLTAGGAADQVTLFVRDPEGRRADLGDHRIPNAHIDLAPLHAVDSAGATRVRTLIFCVPDDVLRRTVREWERRIEPGRTPSADFALHTSGADDASALAPIRATGAGIASWHPLVALAEPRAGAFAGVTFGVEGDPTAVDEAARLSAALGARSMPVRPEAKALYHLAAVFGSNYLVGCLSVAARLLVRARLDGGTDAAADAEGVLGALAPLARSALANVEAHGLPRGVTGPIVRGDIGTVRRHLEALDPASGDLYRALGAEVLRMRADELPHAVRARLWRELLPRGDRRFETEEETADDE